VTAQLFGEICRPKDIEKILEEKHYLGPAKRGFAWSDEFGVLVLASPTSRHLPSDWLELTRWCLNGQKNGGSKQWSKVAKYLREEHSATTVVSYSDPSVGHSGALYKACNWIWAPTWQRLRPPPSQGGSWDGKKIQSVKDRWVFPLKKDDRRISVLAVKDESLLRRGCPSYQEPKKFH
jgi:hypothetical protein